MRKRKNRRQGKESEGQSACKVGCRSHDWGKEITKNKGKEVAALFNFDGPIQSSDLCRPCLA
jgi:hypothetical protein